MYNYMKFYMHNHNIYIYVRYIHIRIHMHTFAYMNLYVICTYAINTSPSLHVATIKRIARQSHASDREAFGELHGN